MTAIQACPSISTKVYGAATAAVEVEAFWISRCDRDTALARIAEVLGQKQIRRIDVRKPDAIYQYPDSQGKAIVEKLRFRSDDGSKYFEWRRPDGKGGYESGLGEGFRKRLYRLPNDSLFEQTGGLAVPFT